MTILRSTGARLATLTLGVAAVAVPVLAQPASAAVQSCEFVLNSVTADDVQEPRSQGDEIILELDGQRFPTISRDFVRFRAPVSAGARAFDNAKKQYADDNPLTVRLIEDDILFNDRIGNAKTLECTGDQTDQVLVFRDASAQYRVKYDVNLLG